MAKATSVIDVVLGEAGGKTAAERYEDMKAIISVMVNRSHQLGVPLEDVIRTSAEFNAYGKALPKGVENYRGLAEQALTDVLENGPVHKATFYATPSSVKNLPKGLQAETETAGHQFFSDPKGRAVRTASGYREPSESENSILAAYAPEFRADPSPFDALFGGYAAQPEGLSGEPQQGFLSSALGVERSGYGSPFGALGDRITSDFGWRVPPATRRGRFGSAFHRGVDLSLAPGVGGYPAEAAAGGTVTYAGPRGGYGNMVEIAHPDGTRTRYGHLSEIGSIAIGDQIARGTPIGLVGNTGNSRAEHLHFEMIGRDGNRIDPETMVDFDAASRVPTPTPAERETEWQSAVPMAVERRDLEEPGNGALAQPRAYDQLAGSMRQSGGLDLSGRQSPLASLTQGLLAQRDAVQDSGLTLTPQERDYGLNAVAEGGVTPGADANGQLVSYRATPDQLADMQLRANFQSEVNQARGAVSPSTDMAYQDPSAGKQGVEASVSRNPFDSILSPLATNTHPTGAGFLNGVQPSLVSSYAVDPASVPTKDISTVSGLADNFVSDIPNPGLLRAQAYGMEPHAVQTVDMYAAVSPQISQTSQTIEGPATAQMEAATERQQAQPEHRQPTRFGRTMRNVGASLAGGLAGSMAGGPFGAVLGAVLGRELLGTPSDAQRGHGILSRFSQGLLGDPWSGVGNLNNLGSGAQASYGAWGGQRGDTALASDGSRITNLGGGLVSRIDKNGVETRFRNGEMVGGDTGGRGLLSGFFSGLSGGTSGTSQADRASTGTGLY